MPVACTIGRDESIRFVCRVLADFVVSDLDTVAAQGHAPRAGAHVWCVLFMVRARSVRPTRDVARPQTCKRFNRRMRILRATPSTAAPDEHVFPARMFSALYARMSLRRGKAP